MSKCALPAFSQWLIILQTHSAAKTLVDHFGLVKGWDLSSLSEVNTSSSSLAPSSSWVVSTEATEVKSIFFKTPKREGTQLIAEGIQTHY